VLPLSKLSKDRDAKQAKQFFEKQWGRTTTAPLAGPLRKNLFNQNFPYNLDVSSRIECKQFFSNFKINKDAGPHDAISDVFNSLHDNNMHFSLHVYAFP
jgi:hypothetical protein